jgi:hypothetical protein
MEAGKTSGYFFFWESTSEGGVAYIFIEDIDFGKR